MGPRRTHYEVLGVAPDATHHEIRAAYRERARRLHPDVGGSPAGTGDEDEIRSANEAWRILRDPEARTAYDRELSRDSSPPVEATVGAPLTVDDEPEGEATTPLFTTDSLVVALLARGWPVVVLAIVVAVFVFTAYATNTDDGNEPPTDGAGAETEWQVGDCLDRLPEPTEVSCAGSHDAVVAAVLTDDETCAANAGWFEADITGPSRLCIVYDR
jgi:hypothetical protein